MDARQTKRSRRPRSAKVRQCRRQSAPTLLTRTVRCRRSGIVFFLPAAEDLPAARAVQGGVVVFGAEVVVAPTARTLALQRVVSTDHAVAVIDLVGAKARADGASLRHEGHSRVLTLAAQPARGIHGRAAVANLEVKMRRQVGIG